MQVNPYKDSEAGKKEQVAKMFNNIAYRYDFLNHFLSLGIDRIWRKKTIRLLREYNPKIILDVATGTGDFAIQAVKLNPEKIIGIDIAKEMLKQGRDKVNKKKLQHIIELYEGDSEDIGYEENYFNAALSAFGVRNFENLSRGLAEIYRVLKPEGVAAILEFSKPDKFPFKQIYRFYFKRILPLFGRLVSKDNVAYSYLPESVDAFPEGQEFLNIMCAEGFSELKHIRLTGGIASIYFGRKLEN